MYCDGENATRALPQSTADKNPIIEGSFKSQIHRTVQEHRFQKSSDPVVAATDPLENYIAIVHQLLGPEPLTPPVLVDMPGYVSGSPSHLDQGHHEFLETKKAFGVPTARFRNALLKSYVLWVHPQMPILDMDNFLCEIAKNDGHNSISPLLYYAVMFAASGFVDISYIHHEGYTSRGAARDVMFQRVKVFSHFSR